METRLTKYQDVEDAVIIDQPEEKKAFILGNTRGIELQNLQDDYLVPVFSRDNVETISHNDFINTVFDAAQTFYQGQQFLEPNIRVSHEMKLRTRKGSGKLVENLTDEDSGSYYQRMMFIIEIPSITYNIEGNDLTLQIVGVRSYSETNLLGNASQKQLFRVGVGFLNQVCTNMLLSTDGVKLDIKVTNTADLYKYCMELFSRYNYIKHVEEMRTLKNTFIDVTTFAQFLGKARMYQALSQSVKTDLQLPELILNEAQINAAVRDYYSDENFASFGKNMSGWNFYQLLTNYKNNYIDTMMERTINAYDISLGITKAISGEDDKWGWFIE